MERLRAPFRSSQCYPKNLSLLPVALGSVSFAGSMRDVEALWQPIQQNSLVYLTDPNTSDNSSWLSGQGLST